MGEKETIWLAEFENGRKQYVLAPNERKADTVLKRMFNHPRYDFYNEDYDLEDTGMTDVESAARGDEKPFSVIEARRYFLIEHEKRVNQAGFKGIYDKRWDR